jgi:hypothetical protein
MPITHGSFSDRQLWRPERGGLSAGSRYVGEFGIAGRRVWVDEHAGPRVLRCALEDPVFGFTWGRPGPRTRDLAVAILQDATGDAALAERHAGAFMREVLVALPVTGFELSGDDVAAWLSGREPRSPQ